MILFMDGFIIGHDFSIFEEDERVSKNGSFVIISEREEEEQERMYE